MIIRIVFLCMAVFSVAACNESGDRENPESDSPDQQNVETENTAINTAIESVEIVPGLTSRILRAGDGAVAEVGQIAVVHYTGWLHDPTATPSRGNKFDSSLDRNQHFEFEIGGGQVISGWDQGVVGMRVGELRELTIAPGLAYGDRKVGELIPARSTLVFEVELADLKGGEEPESETL